MFERFTDRARRVVILAQEEAKMLNHYSIGTEHLLLGLIHESEGVAASTLLALGINLDNVREGVKAILGMGIQPPVGHIPFTPRSKKVLNQSLHEALQLGHNYIGTEHILLALAREGEGIGAQVLVRLGLDLNRIRPAVLAELERRNEGMRPETPVAPNTDVVRDVIAVINRKMAVVAVFDPDNETDELVAKMMRQHNAGYEDLVKSAATITLMLNQRRLPSN